VIDRPQRLTYYYRNDSNEVLRISFMNADRLAVEVRKYESEDEIDFTTLKALPANLISYDAPLREAEQNGGFAYRQRLSSYLVRVILTWPSDREAPVYGVVYGPISGSQINAFRVCCFDAKTGEAVDSLRRGRFRFSADRPFPGLLRTGCHAVRRHPVQPLLPG
jgi:hypothetical protein